MTVAELIEALRKYPPDLPVCYSKFSEQCLLEEGNIRTDRFGLPRPDGWVPSERPGRPTQTYVLFPGN